jgi:hypothetical protein|tara:strand:+ start:2178 stop:3518 length:1341 start_codon:yes stop_codon:yes gene_type:complete
VSDYIKDMFIEVSTRATAHTHESTTNIQDEILDLIYEQFVAAPVPIQEMATDRAKEFVLSLPKFVPTESWGDPSSMDRQQITKLFNVMGGASTIEGKLQFLQRIVDPSSKITSPRRIISSIIILEALRAVVTSFNASSAGFVFEGFLSALFQGVQEAEISAKGNLPIQDLIAFSESDRPVPISLKLLNKTTNIEGSYTNLIDGLDEFGEMIYIVARKDPDSGGIAIEKFRFDQNNFIDALSTSARGGSTKGANLFQLPKKTASRSIAILKSANSWQEKYDLLQHTSGYSERIRKKRELVSQTDQAAAEDSDSEEAQDSQLSARQELSEAVTEEWGMLLERAGGTQWHISPQQLISFGFVEYQELGELPYSEEAILNVARIHMDKLNLEIMELFTATQNLSENVNRYFLVENRSSAINSGTRAIQDSVKIQQSLQSQLNEPDVEETP